MTTLQASTRLVLRLLIATAAAVAIGVVLTACGSSNSSDSGSAVGDAEQSALAFAQCIRTNGVPSFPDPVAKADGTFGFDRPQGVAPGALDDALESCQSEARAAGIDALRAAQDPKTRDQLLKFSRCMRRNGVADFPDPKPNATGSLRSIFGNIDIQSPRVQTAMQSCDSILSQLGGPLSGGGG